MRQNTDEDSNREGEKVCQRFELEMSDGSMARIVVQGQSCRQEGGEPRVNRTTRKENKGHLLLAYQKVERRFDWCVILLPTGQSPLTYKGVGMKERASQHISRPISSIKFMAELLKRLENVCPSSANVDRWEDRMTGGIRCVVGDKPETKDNHFGGSTLGDDHRGIPIYPL